jgi:hypothetical protein
MPEWFQKIIAGFFVAIALCSCASVKPYQRAYLNDREMQLDTKPAAQFENYYESIREGSTTAEGGKATDGCGCK